jgi:hypothetical protein
MSYHLMHSFSFAGWKSSRDLCHSSVNIVNTTDWTIHLKIVTMVKFSFYVFHYS